MLALRQFPMFAHADLDELAMLGENVVERAFAAGDVVAGNELLSSVQFVVGGRLEVGDALVDPRSAHGLLEVIAHRPTRAAAIASMPTRTLELGASDYFEVLEDNFGLLLGTVRDLATQVIPVVDHRCAPVVLGAPLGLVERMIILRHQLPFASARLEALAILAHAATEVRWPAGATIGRAGARADRAVIVLEGTLRAGERELGPGHAIGMLETLANVHHGRTSEAVTPVRALVTQASTILDVLEDHTDVALAMMRTFARALVDQTRNGCATRGDDAALARDPADSGAPHWRVS
jgi:CRP-like cAMP-binding protein